MNIAYKGYVSLVASLSVSKKEISNMNYPSAKVYTNAEGLFFVTKTGVKTI